MAAMMWACAWCWQWNGPEEVYCTACGRDIVAKWERGGFVKLRRKEGEA